MLGAKGLENEWLIWIPAPGRESSSRSVPPVADPPVARDWEKRPVIALLVEWQSNRTGRRAVTTPSKPAMARVAFHI